MQSVGRNVCLLRLINSSNTTRNTTPAITRMLTAVTIIATTARDTLFDFEEERALVVALSDGSGVTDVVISENEVVGSGDGRSLVCRPEVVTGCFVGGSVVGVVCEG